MLVLDIKTEGWRDYFSKYIGALTSLAGVKLTKGEGETLLRLVALKYEGTKNVLSTSSRTTLCKDMGVSNSVLNNRIMSLRRKGVLSGDTIPFIIPEVGENIKFVFDEH